MPEQPDITAQRIAFAASLEAEREAIVSEWMTAVRDDERIPSADRLTFQTLKDHFPDILRELIETLWRSPSEESAIEIGVTGNQHGKARWRAHYRIDEMLRELARMRQIIVARVRKFCAEHPALSLWDEANEQVHRFFDTIAATSARQYIELQQAEVLLRSNQLQHAYELVRSSTEQLRSTAASRLRLMRAVSHELNNGLQAVGFAAEALLQDGYSNDRQPIVQRLSRSAQHLQSVIDRLHLYSTLLAGEARLKRDRLDLADFIQTLRYAWDSRAHAKGITMHWPETLEVPTVVTDSEKLGQIADILISNAVEFTEKGSIQIQVSKDDPGRWTFSVEDTGIGIDPVSARLIFSEFHQSGPLEHQGVRLGLVIARHLAHLMDGEITFVSTPRVGSRFEVNLPV